MPGNLRFSSRRLALLFLTIASGGLSAQTYKVETQKTIRIEMPGATAAYVLDSTYADATAENGIVTVSGKIAGRTHIMVVTAGGPQPFEITVTNPPVKIPAGVFNPFNVAGGIESGFSESRYNSYPSQLQTTLDFSRREGGTTIHTHLSGIRHLGTVSDGQSRTTLSSAYFQISTPRREITILDQFLDESRLGIAGS